MLRVVRVARSSGATDARGFRDAYCNAKRPAVASAGAAQLMAAEARKAARKAARNA